MLAALRAGDGRARPRPGAQRRVDRRLPAGARRWRPTPRPRPTCCR
ncbi:MAG: hypothetical protein MZW92_57765 [Comamonadaceae bacterium]|nr:hypothetical protein [Comamonadaceae bacterium]